MMHGEGDSEILARDAFPNLPSLKKQWQIPREVFETFLAWLDADREEAGKKYEDIRRRLIMFFTCRRCFCPEDLADETINRVIFKAPEIAGGYTGDPAAYFSGVARKVLLEYVRRRPPPLVPARPPDPGERDKESTCLERCLDQQTADNRRLIIEYYQEARKARIDRRQTLAQGLGIELNALRIRVFRIRAALHRCVLDCLKQTEAQRDEIVPVFLT